MEQKIILAGYNIDSDVIEELKSCSNFQRSDITPETLSAAYARISRDPNPIYELRKVARDEVEKARKSNSTIIFKMGHHSVAEHAVFNFDIIGISRLAVEAIEHFRLCSFTEKSQRYITLDNDFVIPNELMKTGLEDEYVAVIKKQNELYHKLNEKLQKYVFDKYKELAKEPKNKNLLEGWAKEDARYVTSLATQTQLGLTINARNLELIFRRFASQENQEIKDIAKKMFALVEKIAPSIILFTEANEFDSKTYALIEEKAGEMPSNYRKSMSNDVELINYTQNADDLLVSSLIFATKHIPMKDALFLTKSLTFEKKKDIVKCAFKHMKFYDTVLREFENIDLVFDIVLSASCFAQLKRHRMATIIKQLYDPCLGITIPQSIVEVGMEKDFKNIIAITEELYFKIKQKNKIAAEYILTNSHRRRILFKCNARELYHISRLREDIHAQWDIRNISKLMSDQAKKVMPLTMLAICGKDKYQEVYNNIFS